MNLKMEKSENICTYWTKPIKTTGVEVKIEKKKEKGMKKKRKTREVKRSFLFGNKNCFCKMRLTDTTNLHIDLFEETPNIVTLAVYSSIHPRLIPPFFSFIFSVSLMFVIVMTFKDGAVVENGQRRQLTSEELDRLAQFEKNMAIYSRQISSSLGDWVRSLLQWDPLEEHESSFPNFAPFPTMPTVPCFCITCD